MDNSKSCLLCHSPKYSGRESNRCICRHLFQEISSKAIEEARVFHVSPRWRGSVAKLSSDTASGGETSIVIPTTGHIPDRTSGSTIGVFNQEAVTLAVPLFGLGGQPCRSDGRSSLVWWGPLKRSAVYRRRNRHRGGVQRCPSEDLERSNEPHLVPI